MTTPPPAVELRGAALAYGSRTVCEDVSLVVPRGSFTALLGPNGCGKSTVLKALTGALPVRAGEVLLEGRPRRSWPRRELARRMGLLPQGPTAPEGLLVRDLVARGRHPHRSAWRRWTEDDEAALVRALAATGTSDLAGSALDGLSGGQRQRAWLAMLLAQETPTMLLDEPTTFLDISHQHEVLELLHRLHTAGRTLVAVLHDLGQAARYATDVVVMDRGRVVAHGAPDVVLTADLVEAVYGVRCRVGTDPVTATPVFFPEVSRAGEPCGTGQRAS